MPINLVYFPIILPSIHFHSTSSILQILFWIHLWFVVWLSDSNQKSLYHWYDFKIDFSAMFDYFCQFSYYFLLGLMCNIHNLNLSKQYHFFLNSRAHCQKEFTYLLMSLIWKNILNFLKTDFSFKFKTNLNHLIKASFEMYLYYFLIYLMLNRFFIIHAMLWFQPVFNLDLLTMMEFSLLIEFHPSLINLLFYLFLLLHLAFHFKSNNRF